MITILPYLMSTSFVNVMHYDFWVTHSIHFIHSFIVNDIHINPFEVTLYGYLAIDPLDRILR